MSSPKLGHWLTDQRQSHKGKRPPLAPEREALLQSLVDNGILVCLSLHLSSYYLYLISFLI